MADTLQRLGITHLAERATHHLSYGEQKKAAIAGAVAMRPAVLLLDEPTAGLDPVGVADMRAILDDLHADGTTLLVATHDVDFALAWAEDAAVIHDGAVTQGPVDRILADTTLVAQARLEAPGPLQLARLLGLTEHPRTIAEAAALIANRTIG